jgi:hypothetical protein
MSIIRKEQLTNPLSASYAATASVAISSSYATTASFAQNANVSFNTGSLVTTSSFNAFTASINSFTSSINTFTASYNTGSFTGSFTGSLLGTSSWAVSASHAVTSSYYKETDPVFTAVSGTFVTTSSFNNFTSSYNTGSFSGSFIGNLQGTASWATNAINSQTASFLPVGTYQITSSWANNALTSSYINSPLNQNLTIFGNQTITGSLTITSNLTVLGTTSIQYISESTLNIGTNLITVNTLTPSVRFGGLAVIDSGSSPLTSASFLYDSVQDEFIFVHRGDGINITSSHFILGPETYNNLGNETYLTVNRIPKGKGNEHLNDSNISDNGTLVNINSNTNITGSLTISDSLLIPDNINSVSRSLIDSSGNTSINWENRTLNTSIAWDDGTFYPTTDDSVDLGISVTRRFRYGYFAREIYANGFIGTSSYATLAQSASLVLVDREAINGPAYLTYTSQIDPSGIYTMLYNTSSMYLTGSTFVVPNIQSSFTGSLLGTASFATTASFVSTSSFALTSSLAITASYINPTFISASAAASGFGGNTNTGSLLTTASVSLNTITFTKGDGSTFPIIVNTGSGGSGGGIHVDSIFGSGQDGNATIASSTTTLTRDFYYDTLTLGVSGVINTSGWRLFCKTLVLSGSGANVNNNGAVGSAAPSGTGGTLGAGAAGGGFTATGQSGTTGANGAATSAGATATAVATLAVSTHPNVPGASGKGGNTALRAGGAAGATNTVTNIKFTSTIPFIDTLLRITTQVNGGAGGRGGSSGASDVATAGRGGGGGGGGGGSVVVFAKTINVTNGIAPVFSARGGAGGAGAATSTADVAGGGGGSGGSGGYVIIVYSEIIGSLTDAINVSGGNGGDGGSGGTSGAAITGGNGGGSGGGGRIVLINVTTGTVTHVLGSNGAAGASATGTAGALGATAASVTLSL